MSRLNSLIANDAAVAALLSPLLSARSRLLLNSRLPLLLLLLLLPLPPPPLLLLLLLLLPPPPLPVLLSLFRASRWSLLESSW
jgi:hypothetical protein